MTPKEFVLWLKGFTQGIEEYRITPTPTQWNVIKDKLAEVNDEPKGVPIGEGGLGVPNTQPFPIGQEPHIWNVPICTPNGTVPSPGFVVTTTPGTTITTTSGSSSSSIGTITTPNGMSTSTTYGYPSGSGWSYTSND